MEPTSVVSKAWEQSEKIAERAPFERTIALITGAGPIGLLAALLGVQRGYEVHVLDRIEGGPKPAIVHDLGATYHSATSPPSASHPTSSSSAPATARWRSNSPASWRRTLSCVSQVSPAAVAKFRPSLNMINKQMVLENMVLFGSVNAARRHYEQAAAALAKADPAWLARLVSRKVPLTTFADALARNDDDVKVAIDLRH